MPPKTIHTPTVALLLFLLVAASSCHNTDNAQLAAGDCFVTTINNKELIIRLDNFNSDNISASYFYTNTLFEDPHSLTVEVKKRKGVLRTAAQPDPVKIKWRLQQDRLTVRCKSGNLPEEIILERCTPDDNVAFQRQFCDSIYSVKRRDPVEYARAEGYWTSYPDKDENFAEIYMRRMPDLLKTEEQSLLMDIYEPADNVTAQRPLVLMIHGGAFYNGDKQDETYVKWCRHFASMGYVAVSLNYRMGWLPFKGTIDRSGYRATQDANAALRYLMHHADDYRINPDWVFTWGTSAGAITALNVAFMRNENRPESVTKEGKINKLASDCTESFRVRAVANMWGAVHDTAILANSPTTSVISFHGDADGIVPYGYGIPFKDMLNAEAKEEISRQLRRLLSTVGISSENTNGFWDKAKSLLNPVTEKIEDITAQLSNQLWNSIVSPMYGSACIHEYLNQKHVRNKLFTVEDASQHSLHVDKHRNIVPYFYTIQDSVAQFFYEEIIPDPVNLQQEGPQLQYFHIVNTAVAEVHWQVDGGVLLESSDCRAKVVFFKDASRHAVRVCGKYKNGVEFCEEMVL